MNLFKSRSFFLAFLIFYGDQRSLRNWFQNALKIRFWKGNAACSSWIIWPGNVNKNGWTSVRNRLLIIITDDNDAIIKIVFSPKIFMADRIVESSQINMLIIVRRIGGITPTIPSIDSIDLQPCVFDNIQELFVKSVSPDPDFSKREASHWGLIITLLFKQSNPIRSQTASVFVAINYGSINIWAWIYNDVIGFLFFLFFHGSRCNFLSLWVNNRFQHFFYGGDLLANCFTVFLETFLQRVDADGIQVIWRFQEEFILTAKLVIFCS